MSQNGQTNFENLAAFAAIFLRCVWPIYDIAKKRVKTTFTFEICVREIWEKIAYKHSETIYVKN